MKQSVHVYILDTLSDWEIGYAVAGINNPVFQKNPGSHGVKTVALTRDPILTVGGLRILPDFALDEVEPQNSAMLVLSGGLTWDRGLNSEAIDKAKAFLAADKPVAAICGATAGLARAGLLDRVRHTSNAREYLAATGYAGAAFYQDSPAVTDGLITTAGVTSPIEFAREIMHALKLYEPEALAAWFALFKTGDLVHFQSLMQFAHP